MYNCMKQILSISQHREEMPFWLRGVGEAERRRHGENCVTYCILYLLKKRFILVL